METPATSKGRKNFFPWDDYPFNTITDPFYIRIKKRKRIRWDTLLVSVALLRRGGRDVLRVERAGEAADLDAVGAAVDVLAIEDGVHAGGALTERDRPFEGAQRHVDLDGLLLVDQAHADGRGRICRVFCGHQRLLRREGLSSQQTFLTRL